ncbi:MAG: ATPase domain-containing protein, partial [Thermoplasmata archaeon]
MSEQVSANETSVQPKDHPRCATGIEGLDGILNGGVPVGNTVLVVGSCGTGKTTLSIEILVNGAKLGENSAYLAATEPAARVIE